MSKKTILTARTADRFTLYEASVQAPEAEVDFIVRVYQKLRRRRPLTLREDFCGSAAYSAAWVKSARDRRATGIDLDPEVLAWARRHHLPALGAAASRLTLVNGDVLDGDMLDAGRGRFDVIAAYNYSYCVFKTRPALLAYFTAARRALAPGGLFFLDLFGGSTAQQANLEPRAVRGFTYIWEQASFNPIDNGLKAYIHFEFKDGSRLPRAFSYDWRLWQIAEIREALGEVGFSQSHVYWEDTTADGEASGRFRQRAVVENDPGWNAYIVAER